MDCKEKQPLKVLRAAGDTQEISVGGQQEQAAIEEAYEAWEAVNRHECSEECERD